MKRLFFLLLFLASFGRTHAQVTPALQSLVDAEKAFAALSVSQSIRSSFLANFDESTIGFKEGTPVHSRADWEARKEGNGYLFWWPVYADIAASEDFGYTTGPAQWGGTRAEPKPAGGIYYSSVWGKDKSGKWKVLIDLGSATYNPAEKKTDFTTPHKASASSGSSKGSDKNSFLEQDRKYMEELNAKNKSFLISACATEARIHRPGKEPFVKLSETQPYGEPTGFAFEQAGGEIASSGDMGFTYGKVTTKSTKDGKDDEQHLGFMRVWQKQNGVWKIVLDVIGS